MRDAVDFQSHTRFHPMLTACAIDVCNEELIGSRADIAAITGSPARHLAYPNGDYTSREMRAARGAGYCSARTIDLGWVGPHTDPFEAADHRGLAGQRIAARLAADLTGITSYLTSLRKGRPRGRRKPAFPHPGEVA